MKKSRLMFVATTSFFFLLTTSAQATPNGWQLTDQEQSVLSDLQHHLQISSRFLVDAVTRGTSSDGNKILMDARSKLEQAKHQHPRVFAAFSAGLDAKNPAVYQPILDKVAVRENERRILSFPDGSFLVVTSTPEGYGSIRLSHRYNVAVWGIYKAADLNLITTYDAGYQYSSLTVVGTDSPHSAWYPTQVISGSSSTVTNYALWNQAIETKASFHLRDSPLGGQWFSRDYSYVLHSRIYCDGSVYNWADSY